VVQLVCNQNHDKSIAQAASANYPRLGECSPIIAERSCGNGELQDKNSIGSIEICLLRLADIPKLAAVPSSSEAREPIVGVG
jgi:hypothetical protein